MSAKNNAGASALHVAINLVVSARSEPPPMSGRERTDLSMQIHTMMLERSNHAVKKSALEIQQFNRQFQVRNLGFLAFKP